MESKTHFADGESITVHSSSSIGTIYTVKRKGNVISCTCKAWQFQNLPIEKRSCKHIKQLRGDQAEKDRVSRGIVNAPSSLLTRSPVSSPFENRDPVTVELELASRPVKTVITTPLPSNISIASPSPETMNPSVDGTSFLLAHSWDGEQDPTGYWMSEKLDGVRAWWKASEEKFYSRQGNEFTTPGWFKKGLPPWDLDGELFGGRGKFQDTVGIVKRVDGGDAWKGIMYIVFDAPTVEREFETRIKITKRWFKHNEVPYATVLNQMSCNGIDHLRQVLDDVIENGGEGIMLRQPMSMYVAGRSRSLLKVKKIHDAEALVTGYKPGTGKHDGRMGALIVAMPDGKEFKIGTGFSDAQRENPPMTGSVVSYAYQELTRSGVPRFARFLRVRGDVTWDDVKGSIPITSTRVPTTVATRPGQASVEPTIASPPSITSAIDNPIVKASLDEVMQNMSESARVKKMEMINKIINNRPVLVAESLVTVDTGARDVYEYRYEYHDDVNYSHKFWEVSVTGRSQQLRWGKIGSTGQSKINEFPSRDDAIRDSEKRRKSKERECYALS